MHQQEIKFFWPLTEQVPLDLDYTDCEKPKLTVTSDSIGQTLFTTNGTTSAQWVAMSISPDRLVVDVEEVTLKQRTKPSLFRRLVYKAIGVKWEMR